MIKAKKTFFLILISLICTIKVNANIADALFITVGNKAITKSDIVDEIKIILILNNESYSDDKRGKLNKMAIKSTIERNIKQIEIDRLGFLEFSQQDVSYEEHLLFLSIL